jgi:integrase
MAYLDLNPQWFWRFLNDCLNLEGLMQNVHPYDSYVCRHHLQHSAYSKQLRQAVVASGITKRVTAHTFRHAFATKANSWPQVHDLGLSI